MFLFSEKNKYLSILNDYGLLVDSNNYWWRRYPERATAEINMMKNHTNAFMYQNKDKLVWEEKIANNFGSCFLVSIETQGFPFKMPKVFLIEPRIEPSDKFHMFKDGGLCLLHSSEYNSKITVLQTRNRAAAWCFCFEAYVNTGKWPAAEYNH